MSKDLGVPLLGAQSLDPSHAAELRSLRAI
jgi:hypothetical protein